MSPPGLGGRGPDRRRPAREAIRIAPVDVGAGAQANAEAVGALFERAESWANQRLDEAAHREGVTAGLKDALNPNFRPTDSDTIYGRAYNRAGMAAYLGQLEVRTSAQIAEIAARFPGEPDKLREALDAARSGYEATLPAEQRARFRVQFQSKAEHYVATATADRGRAVASQAQADVSAALEAIRLDVDRVANSPLGDVEAEQSFQAAMTRAKALMALNGPREAFTLDGLEFEADPSRTGAFSLEDVNRYVQSRADDYAMSRVLGKFSRIENLGAKERFVRDFEAAYRDGKLPGALGKIDFRDANALLARMQGEVDADRREAEAAHRKRVAEASVFVRRVARMLDSGEEIDPALVARARRIAPIDPELAAEFDDAASVADLAAKVRNLTPEEQEAELSRLRARPIRDPADVARIRAVENAHARTAAAIKRDPTAWAMETGRMDAAPLPLADPEALPAALAARVHEAKALDVPSLTKPEAEAMADALVKAEPLDRLTLLTAMGAGLAEDDSGALLEALAPKQPALAVAATEAVRRPRLAERIVAGQEARKQFAGLAPSRDRVNELTADVLKGATRRMGLAQPALVEAAAALAAVDALEAGKTDYKTDGADFDAAFGRRLRELVGEPFRWNGSAILPPRPDMDESDFEDMLDGLTTEELAAFNARAPGVPPMFGSTPAEASDLRDAEFENVGSVENPGIYAVKVQGAPVLDAAGLPYFVDLSKADEALARARRPKPAFGRLAEGAR